MGQQRNIQPKRRPQLKEVLALSPACTLDFQEMVYHAYRSLALQNPSTSLNRQ